MVAHTNAYFLFGGTGSRPEQQGLIARFDYAQLKWEKAGALVGIHRQHFSAIFDGSSFMIVGGKETVYSEHKSRENCFFVNNKQLTCEKVPFEVDWRFTDYVLPVLFMIDLDDGNVCFLLIRLKNNQIRQLKPYLHKLTNQQSRQLSRLPLVRSNQQQSNHPRPDLK